MSNWKFPQPEPRPGDIVYFYASADRVDPPPYAIVVKHEGNGMLTLHVWGATSRDPDKRRNVRHISDPKLRDFPQAAKREGCWVTRDEHYLWLEETQVVPLHLDNKTPLEIADRLGSDWTPAKVKAVLKRLGMEENRSDKKELAGAK